MKRFTFVYKTTNNLNGKIYVGVHTTDNLDDGYLGSGKHFENALKKYGRNYFKREILSYHYTVKSALAEEARIVDSAFIRREDTYNIVIGGGYLGSGPDHPSYGKPYPVDMSGENNPNFGNRGEKNPLFGKKHTEEMNRKKSLALKGRKLSDKHLEKLTENSRSSLYKIKEHGDRAIELYQLGYGVQTIIEIMTSEGHLSQNRKIPAPYSETALSNFLFKAVGQRKNLNRDRLNDQRFVDLLESTFFRLGKNSSKIGEALAEHGYFSKGKPISYKTTWHYLNQLGHL